MTKIRDKFLDAIEAARPAVADKVTQILDDIIFPWYELNVPYGSTSKALRGMVADKIAGYISSTLWISREESIDLENGLVDEVNCLPFEVIGVFPQNTSATGYDIMVTLSQRSVPANTFTLSMHQFMQDFYPLRHVEFREYDS